MVLSHGSRIGSYEILSGIGAGGMGEVYRARDSKLGRDVAIKVLPEAFARDAGRMARFQREAKVLASLNHPNIATIYGLEDSGTTHALVMELVEGATLADRIKQGPSSVDEALRIAKQICEALEYAHERGIVHRDLKPANVKVTQDDAVKVLDFGLAKAIEGDPSSMDMANSPTISRMATQEGVLLGTAAYMSPEQAKGKSVDRRADIWAFGCVLCEMLIRKMAFSGETVADTLAAVIKTEPDWSVLPPDTPPLIRNLLAHCLKKDPRQRLQSIGDARIAIEEVLSGTTEDVTLAGVAAQQILASAWRRAFGWMILGACAALILVLGTLYFGRKAESRRLLRFTIDPPENGDFGSSLALSPDGSRLVFVATAAGKQALWLRPLDSLQAEPISGTEDADFPFWSPDGASIGFFANGKLKRVDLNSGSIQTLCDVSAGGERGGSWGSSGSILFAPDMTKPLMRIPAAGGTPSWATELDASRQDKSHRWPVFLPDGRHFLFLEERGNGALPEIEAGSLDSTTTQPILSLPADSSVAYAPGFLLFSQNGSLMAQHFDVDRLKVSESATPIAPNVSPVGIIGPTGYVAVSASASGLLVYRSSAPRASQLTLVDRSGKTLNTIGPVHRYSDPALSPDKKQIMVRIPDPDNPGADSLWLVDVASGGLTRFTFDKNDHPWPTWSPDGSWVYFGSNASGVYNIYRSRADGSTNQELLRKSANIEAPGDISRDGRYLLFNDISPKTGCDIWYLPLRTHGDAKIFLRTQATESDERFSPDGRWVAYQSNENSPGDYEVFVALFPPNGSKWQVSSNGGYWPVWSDDGHDLYFVAGSTLMAATVRTGATFQFLPPRPLFAIRPPEDHLDMKADYSAFRGGAEVPVESTSDEQREPADHCGGELDGGI